MASAFSNALAAQSATNNTRYLLKVQFQLVTHAGSCRPSCPQAIERYLITCAESRVCWCTATCMFDCFQEGLWRPKGDVIEVLMITTVSGTSSNSDNKAALLLNQCLHAQAPS